MASTNDLDLLKVASTDLDALSSQIETYYKQDTAQKTSLAWNWERNHLMLDGKQWLVYDGNRENGGQWRTLSVTKPNEYIPRPVTNYIFDAYQTLKSYLLKSKPRSIVRPNTQTHRDKTAAKLATLVLECTHERLQEQSNHEYAAAVLVTYGTVFKKTYWDTTAVSMAKVPRTEIVPRIDPTTGMVVGEQEIDVTDPITGDVIYDEMVLGDVNTTVVEPYRIALDPLAANLHDSRWIMEFSIQPLDWITQTYDKDEPGYTGKAAEVKPETSLSNSLGRFYNLKTSSGTKYQGFLDRTSGGSDTMIENAAVVKEYYERPSGKHPKGRLIVVANGVTLYVGQPDSYGNEMGGWHPYSECRWEIVPGRFWGKSPLDDACEMQRQINSIDSVIILTRKTMAIPQKLIPIGSGVQPGQWTGRPGQEIYYRETSTGIPSTVPPAGVDTTVFQERKQRVEDLKQVTGAIDILKGDRPPGVTAHSALSLLYEVGTGKLFPILDRWKKFIEEDQKKMLNLINTKYREPRADFIKLLKSKNSELSIEEINNFIGEDLYDNCNVVIEAGSNIPKLQAAQQALLMELAQVGVLDLGTPENKMEFLQRMGVIGFDHDIGPDIKRATWENDLLDNLPNSPDNIPVVLAADEHSLHIEVHERRQKDPSYMALPPEVQRAYDDHIAEHQNFIDMEKQQAMMEAAMTGQAPQQPQDPNAPEPLREAGKGVNKDIQKQLFGSVFKPGESS